MNDTLLALRERALSCNQTKSTNGGNPLPYDCFDDAYEMFFASIE